MILLLGLNVGRDGRHTWLRNWSLWKQDLSRWRKSLLHWCTGSRIVFTVCTWRAFSFSMATTATAKAVSLALQRASLMAIMPTVKAMEKCWTVKPLFTQYWITMQPVQSPSERFGAHFWMRSLAFEAIFLGEIMWCLPLSSYMFSLIHSFSLSFSQI